jgi:glycine cleavage system H protein
MIYMVKIEGFDFPDDLYYDRDHMWAKVEGGKVRIGYNAWAADAAGKLVSIKTRPIGKDVKAGKTLGSIESGKWVGSLKVPISGTILEVNSALADNPSIINESPYGNGWVAMIKPDNLEADLKNLIPGKNKDALETWLKEEKAKAGA